MGWMRYFLLGTYGQQLDIQELQEQVDRMRTERDLENWNSRSKADLAEEVLQLQIRLGILVRLLIQKGVVSAEEYAKLIAVGQSKPPSK